MKASEFTASTKKYQSDALLAIKSCMSCPALPCPASLPANSTWACGLLATMHGKQKSVCQRCRKNDKRFLTLHTEMSNNMIAASKASGEEKCVEIKLSRAAIQDYFAHLNRKWCSERRPHVARVARCRRRNTNRRRSLCVPTPSCQQSSSESTGDWHRDKNWAAHWHTSAHSQGSSLNIK